MFHPSMTGDFLICTVPHALEHNLQYQASISYPIITNDIKGYQSFSNLLNQLQVLAKLFKQCETLAVQPHLLSMSVAAPGLLDTTVQAVQIIPMLHLHGV